MASMNDGHVIVVGSIVVDLISYVTKHPSAGQTVTGKSFSQGFGGKGANQCAMAHKLGAHVSMIGKVGDDHMGSQYLNYFDEIGISTANISRAPIGGTAATGVAQILVAADGDNTIVVTPGANYHLTPSEVDEAFQTLLARDDGPKQRVVVCQLEVTQETTMRALQLAKQAGIPSILNSAPIPDTPVPDELLAVADILVPNETEAEALTNLPVRNRAEQLAALRDLVRRGVRRPMITLGADGAVFLDETGTGLEHVGVEVQVDVCDTTGAGDCFVGSLAYLMACRSEVSFREQVRRAVQIAALSVRRPGTQASYPTRAEVEALRFI